MIDREDVRTSDPIADLLDRLRLHDERIARAEGALARVDVGPMRWAVELVDPNHPDGPVYDVTLVNPVTGQSVPVPGGSSSGGGVRGTRGDTGPSGAAGPAGATGATGATGSTLTVIDGGIASSTY